MPTPSRAGIGGPKTAEGKARVALNAVKHGLSSENPVLLELETAEAWEAFRDPYVAALQPVGPVEEGLALELALIQWRRRRVPLYEARAANLRIQAIEASLIRSAEHGVSQAALERNAAEALTDALLPSPTTFDRLLRYETHLDRKFNQTLRHLERLQKTRKQEAAPDCKTSSAPHLQVPAASVPCVASVPSHPPAAENCKTNSHGQDNGRPKPPTTALPVPSVLDAPSHSPGWRDLESRRAGHLPDAAHQTGAN